MKAIALMLLLVFLAGCGDPNYQEQYGDGDKNLPGRPVPNSEVIK